MLVRAGGAAVPPVSSAARKHNRGVFVERGGSKPEVVDDAGAGAASAGAGAGAGTGTSACGYFHLLSFSTKVRRAVTHAAAAACLVLPLCLPLLFLALLPLFLFNVCVGGVWMPGTQDASSTSILCSALSPSGAWIVYSTLDSVGLLQCSVDGEDVAVRGCVRVFPVHARPVW